MLLRLIPHVLESNGFFQFISSYPYDNILEYNFLYFKIDNLIYCIKRARIGLIEKNYAHKDDIRKAEII